MYIESDRESIGFYTTNDGVVDYWTYTGGYEFDVEAYEYVVHYKDAVDDIFEQIKRKPCQYQD